MSKPEYRAAGRVEARADGEGQPRQIVGYAAVFNSPANIAGCFIERIAPGAFSKAISRPDDVRCLFNHRDSQVIGRTKSGTLTLSEDDTGLRYEATPPDATWARDLLVSIERGDVSQSSFQFRALREEWDETGELPIRTLPEVELIDVSPVTYPAYDDTEVSLRSRETLDTWRTARGSGPAVSGFLTRARMDLDIRARRPLRA